MVSKKSWKEFQESGLLWWANRILHTFGWAIVLCIEGGEIKEVYPARVKFRGFDKKSEEKGFIALSKYMKDNASAISNEANL